MFDSISSAVVPLRRTPLPLQTAVDAYRAGRSTECLAALRGHVSRPALILKSRAALRLGDAAQALAVLETQDGAASGECERGEVFALRGSALTLLRRLEEAARELYVARVHAFGAACAELEAEYEFVQATLHFASADLELADAAACRVLAVEPPRFPTNEEYFVPLEHTRARAWNVRGAIAATREDFATQLTFARQTIDELQRARERDAWFWGAALMQLAFHVRDFDLVADADFLRRVVAQAGWPSEMARMSFEIHRALGWSSALRGDNLSAFGNFRACLELAPTLAWRIIAFVDRASLGRELHERHTAREEIEHAAALAESVRWNETGEERIGLAQLAQELAAFSPARAQAALERYRAIDTHLTPYALNKLLRRPRAYESMAEGAVAAALGKRILATLHFTTAFTIFDDIGHRWLAAKAALELAALEAGDRFAAYARCEAAARPGSWLARRVATLG